MLLYLHIPFCHRICPYCSFYKHTPGDTAIPAFIDALLNEARTRIEEYGKPRTLYLGGGTPSMLSPTHLTRLFNGLAECFEFSELDEVTMEANPATFDETKARLFVDLGIRRISLGIQSFHPPTLKALGREHSAEEAAQSVEILHRAAIPSINIDLIFSVPGLNLEDWKKTLQSTINLKPDHISAYNLTYEEDTAFFDNLQKGNMDISEDRDASQFHLAHELLSKAGYEHYETSNYARAGHRSTHNHGYWNGEDYLGLGPSAVSTVNATRHTNVADTAKYAQMIKSVGHAVVEREALTEEQLRLERIALLLRTAEGVPLETIAPYDTKRLTSEGLACIQNGHLILTETGSALVDPIAAELV